MTGRALRSVDEPARSTQPLVVMLALAARPFVALAMAVAHLTWPLMKPVGLLAAAPFRIAWRRWMVVGAQDPVPWRYALRRTYHGFLRHRTIDAAASLAFFSTLTLFPGALAIVSAVAIGQSDGDAVDDILEIARIAIGPSAADALRDPLVSLLSLSSPWASFGVGLGLTLWSLSGYSSAFGRAMNTIYAVQEGRRFFWFRWQMLVLSLALMVLFAAIAAILLITPSIALLYYFTPNVKHPKVRWVSYGALLAIGGWTLATVGFAIYVTTFSKYDQVYGFLGGAVVLLVYAYISNLVLVLGGELDSQIIRVRYLQSGVDAEGLIPLPLRDYKRNLALARHQSLDMVDGRTMRLKAVRIYGEPTLDDDGQPHIRPRFQTLSGREKRGMAPEE